MDHRLPATDTQLDQFADLPQHTHICYRRYGPADAPAVLLIAGLGLQLMYWPLTLIEGLVAAGYQVITPDNRDAGRSSHSEQLPPARWRLLCGWVPAGHYRLHDMAQDMAQLLDALHIPSAHIVGISMGGMIAQTMAAQFPRHVRSLTSIFSTTGNPRVGRAAGSTILRMLASRPAATLEQAQDHYVRMQRHIADPSVPGIEDAWRDYAARAWARTTPELAFAGFQHQIAAMVGSGDRTGQLYGIECPTLVLHGDKDRIVHPSGGAATARAIAGAQFCTIQGMRHQLDASVTPLVLQAMLAHWQQAPTLQPA